MITEADSVWAKEYIDRVLLQSDTKNEICVLSLKNTKFKSFYEKHQIPVYTYYSDARTFIQRYLYRKRLIRRIKKEVGSVDVIQVNLVTRPALDRLSELWQLGKRHILTFWGSDILRVPEKDFTLYRRFFDKVDSINMLTDNMYQKVVEQYGHSYDDKITLFDFGCPMYEAIDAVENEMSMAQCKGYWNIPASDIVVPIGYNSIKEQQHLAIIQAVSSLESELKDKVTFVVHFCYGAENDSEYLNEIEKALIEQKLKYVVIDKFLEKKETAILRRAADVFLYAQTTDALSASVIEYLYSGCILVKPSWLDYSELDKRNIKYITYNDFRELKNAFSEALRICNDENELRDYQNNRDILWNMNSWEVVAPKWCAIYED